MRVIIILFICITTSCVNKIQDIDLIYSDLNLHDRGVNIESKYYVKGNLEFKLKAGELEQVQKPTKKNIFKNGIQIYIYDLNLDTVATISSDSAISDLAPLNSVSIAF